MKINKIKAKPYTLKNLSGNKEYDYLENISVKIISVIDKRNSVLVKVVSNDSFNLFFQNDCTRNKIKTGYKKDSLKGMIYRFDATVIFGDVSL